MEMEYKTGAPVPLQPAAKSAAMMQNDLRAVLKGVADYHKEVVEGLDSKVGEIETNVRAQADELLKIQQRLAAANDTGDFPSEKSSGAFAPPIVKSLLKYSDDLMRNGRVAFQSPVTKAAGDPVTTGNAGRTSFGAGPSVPTVEPQGFHRLLRMEPASGSTVEYLRYDASGQQGAAAIQAGEGVAKAAVTPDFERVTQNALTAAGWAKASKQAMTDQAELERLIGVVLQRSVMAAMNTALLTGSVVSGHTFAGLITQSTGLATTFTSSTYTDIVDAISEGVAAMQALGFEPDGVALSPATWLGIVTARDQEKRPLSGAYLGPLATSLRGLKVAIDSGVANGKALLIDSRYVDALVVDTMDVEAGLDGSDFTKNLATLRCEMRVIPVYRAIGAARYITPHSD